MFSPIFPITLKEVLHILKLVCWASTKHTNVGVKWLWTKAHSRFNKSCLEIINNLQGSKLNIFLAQQRWGHSKTKLRKQQQHSTAETTKIWKGGRGKNTCSPASQRIEWRDSNWLCNSKACPQRGHPLIWPMISQRVPGCCHATRNATR